MYQTFLFLAFLGITSYFGFIFSRLLLKEKRVFVLVPFSILIGINLFNFCVNVFSYFVFIQKSVWIVLILFLLIAVFVSWVKRKEMQTPYEWIFSKKQYALLFFIAFLISFFSGLVAVKSLALDDLFIGHLPLAVTIAEGNFPVMDPSLPDRPLSYHYAPDLLVANLNLIADIPFWLGYDLQIILFSGVLFLLLFALAYQLSKSYKVSVVSAALFLYGTGFQWVYFITDGIPAFWHRFILHENVPAFWSFLTYVAFPKLNTSFIHSMHNHSTALGVPVIFLAIFLYIQALQTSDKKRTWIYILVASVFLGYSALALETFFVIVLLALLALIIISLLASKVVFLRHTFSVFYGKRFLYLTAVFIFVTLAIAYFQGGILSSALHDTDREKIVFVDSFKDFVTLDFAPDPSNTNDPKTFLYLFGFEFFIQFGLPLILIIPALIYFFRKKEGAVLLFAIMGAGAFLVPFLFRFPVRNWEMSRFFLIAIPIFSFIIGIYLMRHYEEAVSRRIKRLLLIGVFFVGISGVISQLLFSVSNLDRFGSIGPLFMKPSTPTGMDIPAFEWIKKNTTLQDRFFPYDPDFIRHTGRFTPGAYLYFTFNSRNAERALYNKLVDSCSSLAISFFKINYFYITPDFPIKKYESCLTQLGAKKVYSEIKGNDFRYLYRIQNP